MQKNIFGKKGEIIAKSHLIKKGYKILEMNYKNKIGEIDIIVKKKRSFIEVLKKKDNPIVFVEVKIRSSAGFGDPAEAVDERKQNKIRQVATMYLKQNDLLNYPCRFDAIAIVEDNTAEIRHIENAF